MELELLDQTIGDCFRERVLQTPDKTAVEFEGQKVTYRKLDELSDWLVHRFHFFGMEKGSRAALWCGNHLQWVIVYLGLQKIGALTILINPGYQEEELQRVLSYAQVEYLFYGESFKERKLSEELDKLDLKQHPYLKQAIPIELKEAVDFMIEGSRRLDRRQRQEIEGLKKLVKPEDIACMMFTSGTTAVPKGVLLSHYSLVNDAAATAQKLRWGREDKICVTVPLFHCFGMTSCLLAGIYAGCSLYLMKYYRSAAALEAVEQAGCTILNGVPSMFLALLHSPVRKEYDISSLKSGIIAGSPISPEEYIRICRELEIPKLQMSYGQTETSPGVCFSSYEESVDEKADNAGYLLEHLQACIFTGGGKRIVSSRKAGETKQGDAAAFVHGEIGIRGFPVMQGYYNRPWETGEVLEKDGFLHTGDLGFFDEKGRLHIEGRIKELIIRGGENISPYEIERCIRELPQIREVKVTGIPQKVLQEEIAAGVVFYQGKSLKEEEIRAHVKGHLAAYKVPRVVKIMERLPVNASGKPDLVRLREELMKGQE